MTRGIDPTEQELSKKSLKVTIYSHQGLSELMVKKRVTMFNVMMNVCTPLTTTTVTILHHQCLSKIC